MKRGAFLAESPIDGHRPLGAFGQPVHMSYVQLRAAVAQRLGERAANLFARPQVDDRAGVIRWVAPVDGEARRWGDLSPEEQADYALDLQVMRAEFDNYLTELRAADGGEAFASVLENALKTPNDGHLHMVGDQPVMTFWGFTELGGESFAPLSAAPPPVAPAAAVAGAAAAEPARRGWLWWLLPLLLLLLLLLLLWWWLFGESEKLTPPLAPVPPVEEVVPPDAAEEELFEVLPDGRVRAPDGRVYRRDALRVDENGRVVTPEGEVLDGVAPEELGLNEEGELIDPEAVVDPDAPVDEGALEDAPLDETPPEDVAPEDLGPEDTAPEDLAPEDPAVEDPATEDPAADDPAAEDPAAEDANDPGAEDPAAEEPPAPEIAPEPGDELEVPPPAPEGETGAEQGADAGDAGATAPPNGPARFMRGQWRSRSDLRDAQGNKVDQTFEFDDKGQGQSVVRRSDGSRCTAPAEAKMVDGKLVMVEKSNLVCPDGEQFEKSETVCERGADGVTRCKGQGFDVKIERGGQ